MSKIYGYARVSTDDQSLDVQRAALEAAGCQVILEEKVSGADVENRAELQLLLKVVGEGDVIIVCKLDRLSRDTLDMLEIAERIGKQGASLKSLGEPWADTTTPERKLIFTIFAGFAEWERARIRQRQREGIAAAKKNGVYKGGKVRFQAETIRAMKAEGKRVCEIARELGCSDDTVARALR